MILVIDNYDSFTWNLVHYLAELGAETRVVRNDDLTAAEAWARLTSDAPVSGVRATVRAGREHMRRLLVDWVSRPDPAQLPSGFPLAARHRLDQRTF